MKGSIRELELDALCWGMLDAARSRTRRGKLRFSLPIGFVWHREIGLGLDPDCRVQEGGHPRDLPALPRTWQCPASAFGAQTQCELDPGIEGGVLRAQLTLSHYRGVIRVQLTTNSHADKLILFNMPRFRSCTVTNSRVSAASRSEKATHSRPIQHPIQDRAYAS